MSDQVTHSLLYFNLHTERSVTIRHIHNYYDKTGIIINSHPLHPIHPMQRNDEQYNIPLK